MCVNHFHLTWSHDTKTQSNTNIRLYVSWIILWPCKRPLFFDYQPPGRSVKYTHSLWTRDLNSDRSSSWINIHLMYRLYCFERYCTLGVKYIIILASNQTNMLLALCWSINHITYIYIYRYVVCDLLIYSVYCTNLTNRLNNYFSTSRHGRLSENVFDPSRIVRPDKQWHPTT